MSENPVRRPATTKAEPPRNPPLAEARARPRLFAAAQWTGPRPYAIIGARLLSPPRARAHRRPLRPVLPAGMRHMQAPPAQPSGIIVAAVIASGSRPRPA